METSTALALLSTGVAMIIAVVVPWTSFRLALWQDQTRWLREQRTQVYIDLLTEAYAEQQWLEYDRANEEVRAQMQLHFSDLRLPPLERARLGVRATMFGSRSVNRLFNRMPAEAFWSTARHGMNEGDRSVLRVRIGRIMDELQKVIRQELKTDKRLPSVDSAYSSNLIPRIERRCGRYETRVRRMNECPAMVRFWSGRRLKCLQDLCGHAHAS